MYVPVTVTFLFDNELHCFFVFNAFTGNYEGGCFSEVV